MKITVTRVGENNTNVQPESEFNYSSIKDPETRRHVENITRYNPARGALKIGAQIGAGVTGTPGNIASAAEGLVNAGQKIFTGKDIPGHETIQKYLPTSENILKVAEMGAGNLRTFPALDNFLQGAASLATGGSAFGSVGKKVLGSGISLGRAAKISGGAQIARQAAKSAGAGQIGQTVAEIAGGLGAENFSQSLIDIGKSYIKGEKVSSGVRNNLEKVIRPQLYKEAESHIPQHFSGSGQKVYDFLQEVIPSDKARTGAQAIIKKTLGSIPDLINKENMAFSLKDAIKEKKVINEKLGELLKDHKSPDKAIAVLKGAVGKLNEFIKESTEKQLPKFWESWNSAETLHKALAPANRQAKTLAKEIAGYLGKSSFGATAGYALKGSVGAIGGPILVAGITQAFQKSKPFVKLIAQSPVARNEYYKALGALAIDNMPLASQSFARLNAIAEKQKPAAPKKLTITKIG